MIKAISPATVNSIYQFIDNRLVPHLAQKKLKQFDAVMSARVVSFAHTIIQRVDDTVFYLEKSEERGAFVVCLAESRSSAKKEEYSYGIALRARADSTTELFIDRYAQAVQKSLLPRVKQNKTRTIIAIAAAFILLPILGSIAVVGFPIFILIMVLTILFTVVTFPFQHLKKKRRFNREQERMESILSIFRDELGITSQADSKDWITFWGVIKSKAPDLVAAVSPI